MATSVSTLGQALDQIERIKQQQSTLGLLQNQLASGKKTNVFSGLETDVIVSKRARADFNALETYINNVDIADRRINQMTITIEELQAQAGNLANVIAGEIQQGEINLENVNDLASNLIPFLEDLVNIQEGDRYLFSGSATSNKPLELSNGTLTTFLQGELNDWQGNSATATPSSLTTEDLIASYRGVNDTVIGYNADLSSGNISPVTVRADKFIEVDYTTLANDSGFKDIIIAASALEQLTTTDPNSSFHIDKIKLDFSDYENATNPADLPVTPPPTEDSQVFTLFPVPLDLEDPDVRSQIEFENKQRADNYFDVFNDLGSMINQAIDDLDQLRFALESDRARLSEIRESHELEQNTLLNTIGGVENVDINEVALELNYLQVQLEASFRVTATISQLNLANFI